MGKREDFIRKLKPIVNDPEKLERFLIAHSNLPGPRGNLELAFGLAEIYNDLDVLLRWTRITEEQADVNNPTSFLAFCSAVCLGKIYTKNKEQKIITILKNLANDGRWRMREAVAFGFQYIGENDFNELKRIFSEWIRESNNFDVLRKGLEFTISVFVAANPKLGFNFMKRWIGKDKVIDKIIKENLKKNRVVSKNPDEVKELLNSI